MTASFPLRFAWLLLLWVALGGLVLGQPGIEKYAAELGDTAEALGYASSPDLAFHPALSPDAKNPRLVLIRPALPYDAPVAAAKPAAPAAIKSLHLFDLPADVTEAEWAAALAEMNRIVARLGYSGAGYYLYKTEGDDPQTYRYFFEGIWPSAEAYAAIHADPDWIAASEKFQPMYEKIKALQIYRRMTRVE